MARTSRPVLAFIADTCRATAVKAVALVLAPAVLGMAIAAEELWHASPWAVTLFGGSISLVLLALLGILMSWSSIREEFAQRAALRETVDDLAETLRAIAELLPRGRQLNFSTIERWNESAQGLILHADVLSKRGSIPESMRVVLRNPSKDPVRATDMGEPTDGFVYELSKWEFGIAEAIAANERADPRP